MTSAQVVETSVTNNSSSQNYTHPDDHTIRTTETSSCRLCSCCKTKACSQVNNRQDSVSDRLRCLGWNTLKSWRTIARLSMPYTIRNNLAYVDNAELHPVKHDFKVPLVSMIFLNFSFLPRTLQECGTDCRSCSIGRIA